MHKTFTEQTTPVHQAIKFHASSSPNFQDHDRNNLPLHPTLNHFNLIHPHIPYFINIIQSMWGTKGLFLRPRSIGTVKIRTQLLMNE